MRGSSHVIFSIANNNGATRRIMGTAKIDQRGSCGNRIGRGSNNISVGKGERYLIGKIYVE